MKSYFSDANHAAWYADGGQVTTAIEGKGTDARYAFRNDDGGQALAILKSMMTDVCHTYGNDGVFSFAIFSNKRPRAIKQKESRCSDLLSFCRFCTLWKVAKKRAWHVDFGHTT